MDYQDQRRIYSVNMQGGDILSGTHTGNQHIDQQTNQTRLLFGNVFEGAVLTVSPQIGHHQQLHHVLPQHQVLDSGQIQMQHLHHESSQIVHMEHPTQMAENVQPLLNAMQVVPVDSADENVLNTNHWCVVCNRSLASESSVVSIEKSSMSSSNRKLSAFLSKITGITVRHQLMCQMCFNLVDHADALEHEFNETRNQILKQVRSTQSYHPSADNKCIENATFKEEEYWDDDTESIPDEDEDDPDVTLASLKKVNRQPKKRQSKRTIKNLSKSKIINEIDNSNYKQKKNRGRSKKKDKQIDEYILPGMQVKECQSCNKVIEVKKFLCHLAQHRMFPCPFCPDIFKRKEIKIHIAKCHQEEVSFPCMDCSLNFDTFMKLRRHCLMDHMGVEMERVQCKICEKTFSNSSALKVHHETIHSKVQLFECEICKETFNQKGNMQNHIKRLHQGDDAKKLVCVVCSKGFICPSDLRKHAERAHLNIKKNKAVCEICSKQFSDPRALKVHINALHTKDIQYPCPECKMIFHSLTNMVTHRRRMHSGSEGRKHACDTCSKAFCSPSDLRVHIKVVHENLRKYVCDICNQSFKVGSHLKYHRRKHTGETPYECPHCGKAFHSPSHIADHVKKVHKTVYIGAHQRRRLNIPADAPPPPPGILPSREHKTKNLLQELPSNGISNMPLMQHSIAVQAGTASSLTMQPVQTMMFNTQPQMMGPAAPMMETHAPNYVNLSYDQANNQAGVPMVVRLLHDIQC